MEFNKALCIPHGVDLLKTLLQCLERKWDAQVKMEKMSTELLIEEKRLSAKMVELEIAKLKERTKTLELEVKSKRIDCEMRKEIVKEIGRTIRECKTILGGTITCAIFGYIIVKCVRCMRCCPAAS